MEIDQRSVECPTCGKKVLYNRWSNVPQDFFCSRNCKDQYYCMVGGPSPEDILRERAMNPDICIVCGRVMETRVRSDKLFCSFACQKKSQRMGLQTHDLVKIRASTINGLNGGRKGLPRRIIRD